MLFSLFLLDPVLIPDPTRLSFPMAEESRRGFSHLRQFPVFPLDKIKSGIVRSYLFFPSISAAAFLLVAIQLEKPVTHGHGPLYSTVKQR